jgi:hypothetical protein
MACRHGPQYTLLATRRETSSKQSSVRQRLAPPCAIQCGVPPPAAALGHGASRSSEGTFGVLSLNSADSRPAVYAAARVHPRQVSCELRLSTSDQVRTILIIAIDTPGKCLLSPALSPETARVWRTASARWIARGRRECRWSSAPPDAAAASGIRRTPTHGAHTAPTRTCRTGNAPSAAARSSMRCKLKVEQGGPAERPCLACWWYVRAD